MFRANTKVKMKKSVYYRVIVGSGILFMLFLCIVGFQFRKEHGFICYSEDCGCVVAPGESSYLASQISLTPGIYQVIVDYEMSSAKIIDRAIFVQDETLSPEQLRCSGGPVYDGRSQIDFSFILKSSSQNIGFFINEGTAQIRISHIEIRNTGKQWTVIGTIGAGAFWLLIVLLNVYKRYHLGLLDKGQILTGLLLIIIWTIASLPLFHNMTFSTADNGYHMQRIEGVMNAIKDGIIPVRLEPHWIQGYGYANGIFYCDLFLFPSAILRLLGFSVTFAYNFYCMLVNAALVYVSYKCFYGIFQDTHIALATVIMYTLSCMHFYKLIQTGAIGEGTALIFLPLILLGMYRLWEDEKTTLKEVVFPFVLGAGGLICCHVLSTEITVGIVILFLVSYLNKAKRIEIWKKIGLSVLGTLLFTAWFVVPFLDYYIREDLHIKHVFARTIQHEGLLFPQLYIQFWLPGGDLVENTGLYHAYPAGVGIVLFFSIIFFLCLWFLSGFEEKLYKNKHLLSLAKRCALVSLLLMIMSMRCFPWDWLQSKGGVTASLISSLQFPNRLLEWATLLAAFVAGYNLLLVKQNRTEILYRAVVACCVLMTLVSTIYQANTYMDTAKQYYLANPEGMGNGYVSGGEYLIQDTDESLLHYGRVQTSNGVQVTSIDKGPLKAHLTVTNETDQLGYVELPLLFYHGYVAKDSLENKLEVVPGDNNVVRVFVPESYDGDINVCFVSPWYWRVAEVTSLIFVIYLLWFYSKHKKETSYMISNEAPYAEEVVYGVEKKQIIRAARFVILIGTVLLVGTPFLTGQFVHEERIAVVVIITIGLTLLMRKMRLFDDNSLIPELLVLLYMLLPISLKRLYAIDSITYWLYYMALLLGVIVLLGIIKKAVGNSCNRLCAIWNRIRMVSGVGYFILLEWCIWQMNRVVLSSEALWFG